MDERIKKVAMRWGEVFRGIKREKGKKEKELVREVSTVSKPGSSLIQI